MLCDHRFIFGRPGEGAHAPRIPLTGAVVPGGIALVDFGLTALAAWGVSRYYTDADGDSRVPFAVALCALILLGIIAHALFCVPTALNTALGISDGSEAPRGPRKAAAVNPRS